MIMDQKQSYLQNNNFTGTQSLISMKLEDAAQLLRPKILENSSESSIVFELNKILSKN